MLIASATVLLGLNAAALAPVGYVWPATLAYAGAAARGHLPYAAVVGVICLLSGSALEGRPLAGETLWLALTLSAAHAWRTRRRLRDETIAHAEAAGGWPWPGTCTTSSPTPSPSSACS